MGGLLEGLLDKWLVVLLEARPQSLEGLRVLRLRVDWLFRIWWMLKLLPQPPHLVHEITLELRPLVLCPLDELALDVAEEETPVIGGSCQGCIYLLCGALLQ